MPKITLATIAASIDEKYGSTLVELPNGSEVELINPLRLSPAARKAMIELSSAGAEDDVEGERTDEQRAAETEAQIDRLVGIVRVVAATEKQADALLDACSPRGYVDIAILSEVVSDFMGAEKVGEASASQD